jgi:hypothetical protein
LKNKMFKKILFSTCSLTLFCFFARIHWANADERIGTFTIDELRIRAALVDTENVGAQFDTIGSAVAFRWSKDQNFTAYMLLGSKKMRNLPVYYSAVNEDSLGMVEGYAEYSDYYGRFRFGLIPLNFGYDGVLKEHDQIFSRSLFYSARVISLRDEGASFYTETNGYFTQLAIHNGEIDTPSDGRLWTTGIWGFTNDRNIRMQLSLQSGYVKGELSINGTTKLAGVNNGQTARWRNGLFFINWYPLNWNVVMELGGGEMDQGDSHGRYDTTLFELSHQFSKYFTTGFRYNQMDPNRKIDGDTTTELSLVLAFKSIDNTSNFFLVGTKVIEESHQVPNDQLRLVWLLTPISH